MALISLQDIRLSYGVIHIFDGIDIQIHEGEKIALLGRNGTGKSTLMKVINGDLEADSGALIREKGLRTAFLPQELPQGLLGTVYEIFTGGLGGSHGHYSQMGGIDEQSMLHRIDHTLSLTGLDPKPNYETLSAGMKRRVLLGRALVCDPDILLLDEPTNHLDMNSIDWLEDFLTRYRKTVFFVTHDRMFLQKIANRIIELDRGRLFDWKCDYSTFLQRKEAWLEAEEARNILFDKKLAEEEAWIRQGIKARRTRNEGRVRALLKLRKERSERRDITGGVRMEIHDASPSGRMVIEAESIAFSYGEKRIFSGFSTRILRGDRIGIMGPNGCGKSTLIKVLLGELPTRGGNVRHGTGLQAIYFDQLRDVLDGDKTVRENIADGNDYIEINGKNRHVIGYLRDFLFTPERADVRVKVLSGGEKNRLLLARLFARKSNLIVMDEPTNDLDVETIELLEEKLFGYEGTLIIVSHDRSFLNNIVTATYVFEENGIGEYAGGYDDWLMQRKMKVSETIIKPKTVRERKPREKTKLSFREQKELQALPGIIEEKEQRKKEIIELLGDPGFYQKSGDKVNEVKAELEALEEEMEGFYARWEELDAFDREDR